MGNTTTVRLSDRELMMLDGLCSDEVQKAVEVAARRILLSSKEGDLPEHLARLIADVVMEGEKSGLLVYQRRKARFCSYCEKRPDPAYVLFKSGPRKGQPNYDRPLYLTGIDFADSFVRMEGVLTVGACEECVDAVLPRLIERLQTVQVELPAKLGPSSWTRYRNRQCSVCDWSGHEGQMGRSRVMLGEGTYPSDCPECDARNTFGLNPIKLAEGHALVSLVERSDSES